MSSDDDSGFDKEAEREKLREKYGDDDEDRENTQRMSELLLQGATMTGKHCDNCGDPIFRHDGQEFCPTCQHEAQQAREAQQAQRAAADANQSEETRQSATADATEPAETPDTEADRTPADRRADDEPRVEINDVRVADRHADQSDARARPSQSENTAAKRDRRQQSHDHQHGDNARQHADNTRQHADDARQLPGDSRQYTGKTSQHAGDARRRGTDRDGTATGDRDATARRPTDEADDLGPAREALVRKLSDLAHRAEETDDVARARELLGATREAAEALAALDRANR
jgi:uncharacterized Zn finger protein (UPF0148 family)